MQVFFDGQIFTRQRHGGISRLFFELIRCLGQSRQIEQILYRGLYIDNYHFQKEWFARYYGVRNPITGWSGYLKTLDKLFMENVYRLNATPLLIYHSTYFRFPAKLRGPLVVHVYDMIHELYNGNIDIQKSKEKAVKAADLVIAISESTKRDLCDTYHISPEKVDIAYPGAGGIFYETGTNLEDAPEIKRKNGRPYILYVGDRDWYKNFGLLLRVFIENKYYSYMDLVLVGGSKTLTIEQQNEVNKCPGNGEWIKQKFVNDEELAELYAGAVAYVCTSLYEGFGIPLVEAMACGCPVIASNTSSIPEVVGSAGLLYNPEDAEELGMHLDKVINDIAISSDMTDKGLMQAQKFKWETMADIIYKGYLKLV